MESVLSQKKDLINSFNSMMMCTININVPQDLPNTVNSCVKNIESRKYNNHHVLKITEQEVKSDKESENEITKIKTYLSKLKNISVIVNNDYKLKLEEVSESIFYILVQYPKASFASSEFRCLKSP